MKIRMTLFNITREALHSNNFITNYIAQNLILYF